MATTLSPVRTVLPGVAAKAEVFPAMRAAAAAATAASLVGDFIVFLLY